MFKLVQCIHLDYFIQHSLLHTIGYEDVVTNANHIFVPFKCRRYNKIILRMPKLMNIIDMHDDVLRLPLYTSDTNYSTSVQKFFFDVEEKVREDVEEGVICAESVAPLLLSSSSTSVLYRTGILELPMHSGVVYYDVQRKEAIEALRRNRAVQVIVELSGVEVREGIARVVLTPLMVYQFETTECAQEVSDEEVDSDMEHFSSNISET